VAKTTISANDFAFQRVGEIIRPRSWALYGRSGSGKTTLASSFPKPILILDIRDQGTDSISDVKDVFVKEIDDWEEIEEIYYWLKDHPTRFKTIVFDTVTQMQQICMEHIVFKKSKSEVGDWGSMTRRQWGEVAGEMKDQVVNFRDLPLEVVFIAQERASVGEEDDNPDNMITPEVGPAVSPSIARVLNASVSIIGNTFIRQRFYTKMIRGKRVEREEPQYCLRIGPNPVYTTKIRKPKSIIAPAFIENPEYKDIIDLIKGA
jgi:hypothetical protein